jgi:hypothetical protein
MKKRISITLSIILILIIDSSAGYSQQQIIPDGFEKLYQNSVCDASHPSADKIYKNLFAITKNNPAITWKTIGGEDFILVVTWVDSTYYPIGKENNTLNRIIWVTVVPELKYVCSKDGDSLRLVQRLGLPPNVKKKLFMEFWVRPADLYRPCPDNEITDRECQLCFPSNTDSAYKAWFNNLRYSSYYLYGSYKQYPWTQLGYTYDWNEGNPTHVGLSEFIVWTNKKFIVNAYYKTADYCKKKRK